MAEAYPAEVSTFRVIGRLARGVEDGADVGQQPDLIPIANAKVIFTPTLADPVFTVPTAGEPITIFQESVEATTDANGYLKTKNDSGLGVILAFGHDLDINPSGWNWQVTIDVGGNFKPRVFTIMGSAGGVVDLAKATHVPPNPGTELAQWVQVREEVEAARVLVLETAENFGGIPELIANGRLSEEALIALIQANSSGNFVIPVVTGNEARGSGPFKMWIGGTTRPVNMQNGDIWFSEEAGTSTPPTGTAPVITTTTLGAMTVGVPYDQVIQYTGDTATSAVRSSGAIPAGLTLSLTNGVVRLSGTPTTSGGFSLEITVINGAGSDAQAFGGSVDAAPPSGVAPSVTTTSLNALQQGAAFSQQLTADGSTPRSWDLIAGVLPAGLTISSAGLLSGTPTGSGAYDFTVRVTNSVSAATRRFQGSITAASSGGSNYNNPAVPNGAESVWDGVAPESGATAAMDGGSSLRTGNRFYTTDDQGMTVYGARIWNPSDASTAYLENPLTIYAYQDTWSGATVLGNTTFAKAVVASKQITGKRVAGTWTNVLFDTPITIPKIGNGVAGALLSLAVNIGGGYCVIPMGYPGGTTPAAGNGVFMAESDGVGRGILNIDAGTGGMLPTAGAAYGVDIMAAPNV